MSDLMEIEMGSDEDYEGVGFGEFPDLVETEPEEPKGDKPKDADTGEETDLAEPDPEEKPEEAPPEPPPQESPKPDPMADLREQMRLQQQAVYALQQQIAAQAQQQAARRSEPAPAAQAEPEIPEPTDEEWAENATKAAKKLFQREYQQARKQQATEQAQTQQQPRQQPGRQVHPWQASAQAGQSIMPNAFVKGTPENQLAEQIMADPQFGLMQNPDGPRLAVVMAKRVMDSRQSQPAAGNEGPTQQSASPPQDQRRKPPVTHGGGRSRQQTKVQLTADQRREAKRAGVSDESYAESLRAMGG